LSTIKKQPVKQDSKKIIRSESKQSVHSCKSAKIEEKSKSDYKEKVSEDQAIACANVLMIDYFNRKEQGKTCKENFKGESVRKRQERKC
jgi:hypothetical protein